MNLDMSNDDDNNKKLGTGSESYVSIFAFGRLKLVFYYYGISGLINH